MNSLSNETLEEAVTVAAQEPVEEPSAAEAPVAETPVAPEPVEEPSATAAPAAAESVEEASAEEPSAAEVPAATAPAEEASSAAEIPAAAEPAEEASAEEPSAAEAPAEPEPVESMEDYQKELDSSLRKIYEGDVMEGEVIAFNEHGVILDLSYYATGRVPVEEMSADPSFNIMTDVKIGDRFQAIVKRVDDGHGNILLSKKAAESEYSWDTLRQMKDDETVIEGTITEVVKAGAIMYIQGIRGFIPASRLDFKYVEDTAPYLGKKLPVKIIEVDEEQEKLILSAREIATEAHVKKQAEDISRLSVGSIVTGTVESLQNYGAFVNIGNGISGLLHISEISDKRINHPKAALRVGQEVTVMIIRIQDGKISLSIKAINAAKEQEAEEEAHEYHSEYVPNNPFADLLKDFIK